MSSDSPKPKQKSSKFANPSFHREGIAHSHSQYVPQPPSKSPKVKAKESQFVKELVETGKPNWKLAPREIKSRYYGIYMILVAIPILIFPTVELYRRLEGKSTKKVQEGEILENKEVRMFDEAEKWKTEKNSLMYKLFGRDFFLEGFTSKTMNTNSNNENKSNDGNE